MHNTVHLHLYYLDNIVFVENKANLTLTLLKRLPDYFTLKVFSQTIW